MIRPEKRELPRDVPRFVNLHCHTEFSVLDGMSRVARGRLDIRARKTRGQTLAQRARELGQPAVAITDHGTIAGWYRFYHECRDLNVKPIVGCEFYVALASLHRRDKELDRQRHHLTVLARNWRGLLRLVELSTISNVDGYYYRPRIDEHALLRHAGKGDLVVLSGCVSGKLARLVVEGEGRRAQEYVERMARNFGRDFLLEVMPHDFPEQRATNEAILEIANRVGVEIVATNDSHYLRPEDRDDHQVLLAIKTRGGMSGGELDLDLPSEEEMLLRFRRQGVLDEAAAAASVAAAGRLADGIDVEIPKLSNLTPAVRVPGGKRRRLDELCREGLARVELHAPRSRYVKRFRRELRTIAELGFLDYFLIVCELFEWATSLGIGRGPGRGSVCGSLVAYLLKITEVDPLRHGLSFERFLNPARGKRPPDIDMDFADDHRALVIRWFEERFGKENVAHIGSYSHMHARAAVKAVARALGVPHREAEEAAKAIPDRGGGKGGDLSDLEGTPFAEKHPEVVARAEALSGLIAAPSSHASGIVVSPRLRELVPLERRNDYLTTTMTGKEIEDFGMLKFDVLGLKVLRSMRLTVAEIERVRGEIVDLRTVDLDDPDALALLSAGRIWGVFQFDSFVALKECRKMTFERFADVAMMAALVRPGTLQSGTSQAAYDRRSGEEPIEEIHPDYDEVTRETLGLIVFEEQISALFRRLAGFSPEEADLARVVVAKSQGGDQFERFRAEFVAGASRNGMEADEADRLFDNLVAYAGYSFNKSHSYAYGMIALRTAWLKARFPEEFWAGALTVEDSDFKACVYARDAKAGGIQFFPPCVNRSAWAYKVEDGGLVAGFCHLKGLGEQAAEAIEEGRPWRSPEDFARRIDRARLNKTAFRALVVCGAFRELEPNTRALVEDLDEVWAGGKRRAQKGRLELQTSLLNLDDYSADPTRDDRPAWGQMEEERARLEVFRLPLWNHPVEMFDGVLEGCRVDFAPLSVASEEDLGGDVLFVRGYVADSQAKQTKATGSPYQELVLQDESGSALVWFFGEARGRNSEAFRAIKGDVVVVLAKPWPDRQGWLGQIVVRLSRLEGKGDAELDPVERWLFEPAAEQRVLRGARFRPVDHPRRTKEGKTLHLTGGVLTVTEKRTDQGKGPSMGWVLLQGETACRELAVLSRNDHWKRHGGEFEPGARVVLRCRFSGRTGGLVLQAPGDYAKRI